jgi:hypothetical protein
MGIRRRSSCVATLVLLFSLALQFVGASDEVREHQTTGTVLTVQENSVKLRVGEATATYIAKKEPAIAALEVSQLVAGDKVTVTWVWAAETRQKVVRNVEGRGTVVGSVTGLGDRWIEITPEGGKPQRFRPRWIGGAPVDGGGPEKSMLELLGKQKVGAKVALTWELPEGKRVIDIKPVD